VAEGELGNSSTPPAAEPAAAPTATPADPAPVTEAKPAEPQTGSEPAKAEAPAEPPKAELAKTDPDAPLFTLPDDFKPPESMVTKFTEALKSYPPESRQKTADLYVELARDANAQWLKTIEDTNRTNEAACKATFSSEELAAAKTAVGWFASFDPKFREVAKRQLNDPVFTNAMRLVGELLSEDDLGRPEPPPKPVDNRSLRERAQEKLYGVNPS